MIRKGILFTLLIMLISRILFSWGFHAHKRIIQMAIFTLPQEMILFYKKNMLLLEEASVQPDIRRYVMEEEAPRHYIDIDVYGDSAVFTFPREWSVAQEVFSRDTLLANGIIPWAVLWTKYELTAAFKQGNSTRILRYSADIAHYIADAHVPLHTTINYNGQFTGQEGIHRLWETRIPEIESKDYTFWVGKATYIADTETRIWEVIESSHLKVDSVLQIEKQLSESFSEDRKYAYRKTGKTERRDYSEQYAEAYAALLRGMVERQMRASVKLIGDFWFTCWVDAGQPDITDIKILSDRYLDKVQKKDSLRIPSQRTGLHN